LDVQEVVAGYGKVDILQGVSIQVKAGQIATIIGPNGAGKSTLMKTVFGLLTPREGRVTFQDQDITRLKPSELAPLGMGYVPQDKNIFPSLTVEENLELGGFSKKGFRRSSIDPVFELFPFLSDLRKKKAGALSGGERQMVAMGRALVLEPKILLLDEPSAGLAPLLVAEIFNQIQRINQQGVSILIVEQNARKALQVSHWGYVLVMGKNAFSDAGPALLDNPEVGRLYLGG
jgi:ABC-type branched-subunit amino acid transport system ATPase component